MLGRPVAPAPDVVAMAPASFLVTFLLYAFFSSSDS